MRFIDRNDKVEICKEIRKDMRDRLQEQGIYCYDKMPTLIDIAFMIKSYEEHK